MGSTRRSWPQPSSLATGLWGKFKKQDLPWHSKYLVEDLSNSFHCIVVIASEVDISITLFDQWYNFKNLSCSFGIIFDHHWAHFYPYNVVLFYYRSIYRKLWSLFLFHSSSEPLHCLINLTLFGVNPAVFLILEYVCFVAKTVFLFKRGWQTTGIGAYCFHRFEISWYSIQLQKQFKMNNILQGVSLFILPKYENQTLKAAWHDSIF